MDNYLIMKVDSEKEYHKYSYLFDKFSITVILYTKEEDIIKKLHAKVRSYSDWNLFMVELSTVHEKQSEVLTQYKSTIDYLSKNLFFVYGKGEYKPPEKIYIINRRWEEVLNTNNVELLHSVTENIALSGKCRFLLMECSKIAYLKEYDYLKLISLVIILAMNDMPPEIMESYSIYHVTLEIDEDKLYQFLKSEEEALQKEEYYLNRKRYEIEAMDSVGIREKENYIPDFVVDKSENLQVMHKFLGIKTENESHNWRKEKNEILVKIDFIKKKQIRMQKRLNREMKERINFVLMDDLCLENYEIEKIEQRIKDIQKELNAHYIQLWEMEPELKEQKCKSEEELEEILENRYSFEELIKLTIWGFIFSFLILAGGLWAEWSVDTRIQDLTQELQLKWFKENIIYNMKSVCAFVFIFWFYLVVLHSCEVEKKLKNFNTILRQIESKLKENIFHYKEFFSLIYQLRVNQSYLIRNQNFKVHKKQEKKDIEEKEQQFLEKQENFFELKRVFGYLRRKEKNWEESMFLDEKLYIQNYDKQLSNPLYYVERLVIKKATKVNEEGNDNNE